VSHAKERAKHSAEYKRESIRRVVDDKESISSVARSLGLARET
jgi:transposase-like protein